MPNLIKVWPYEKAPKKYKKLNKNTFGSWVVYVPSKYKNFVDSARWLHMIDIDMPQEYHLENGDYLYIGGI